MNPGPFGMTQTGVPFGEIPAGPRLDGHSISKSSSPAHEHPKRPIQGLDCPRSEVSGRRLWGLFARHFPTPAIFPSTSSSTTARSSGWRKPARTAHRTNFRPPNAPPSRRFAAPTCVRPLNSSSRSTPCGVGGYAEAKLAEITREGDPWTISRIPHPSPASPAANRGWDAAAGNALQSAGVWK